MALSELVAFEAAYQVLQPLDDAGRRRALQWLTDALGERKSLSQGGARSEGSTTELVAETGRGRRASKRATKAVPAKRGGRRAATKAPTGRRIRRQMPPADQVIAAYEQAGTINGLADHFDVPTHTVYSWARTLRSRGYDIGRAR
jgi:hypothetical protein